MNITTKNIKDIYRAREVSVEAMELRGYTLIDELFVYSSRFGASNEPALTRSQFIRKVKSLLATHGKLYATLTDKGQFQIYICLFKKTGIKCSRKVDNNTIEIVKDGVRKIRLYDTDILTFKDDVVILNNGGWATNTTKQRMNKYLPSNFSIYKKNYTWYVKDNRTEKAVPYVNGIKLSIV